MKTYTRMSEEQLIERARLILGDLVARLHQRGITHNYQIQQSEEPGTWEIAGTRGDTVTNRQIYISLQNLTPSQLYAAVVSIASYDFQMWTCNNTI